MYVVMLSGSAMHIDLFIVQKNRELFSQSNPK